MSRGADNTNPPSSYCPEKGAETSARFFLTTLRNIVIMTLVCNRPSRRYTNTRKALILMNGHAQKMHQNRDDVAASDLTPLYLCFFRWMGLNYFFSLPGYRPSRRYTNTRKALILMNGHAQKMHQNRDDVAASDLTPLYLCFFRWMGLNYFFSLPGYRPSRRYTNTRKALILMNGHAQKMHQNRDDVAASDPTPLYLCFFREPTFTSDRGRR